MSKRLRVAEPNGGTGKKSIGQPGRSRHEEEKEELRQTILKAVDDLFLKQGYTDFSMRQLARSIGYSTTTLYLYFRDKDDLLFTVIDKGYTCLARQLTAAQISSQEPWEQLLHMCEAYIAFGLQNPTYYQLMFLLRVDYLMRPLAEQQEPRISVLLLFQRAIQAAIDAGKMASGDPETISDVFWATMHGIVTLAIALPMFDVKRAQKLAHEKLYKAFLLSDSLAFNTGISE